jgi:hypothetical protein
MKYEIDSREIDNTPDADTLTADEAYLYEQYLDWFFQSNQPGNPTAEKFAEWLQD